VSGSEMGDAYLDEMVASRNAHHPNANYSKKEEARRQSLRLKLGDERGGGDVRVHQLGRLGIHVYEVPN